MPFNVSWIDVDMLKAEVGGDRLDGRPDAADQRAAGGHRHRRPGQAAGDQRAGEVPVLDSTSIMELDELPQHLNILGGGRIGLEFGQMFRRFGSEVTIVQRGRSANPSVFRRVRRLSRSGAGTAMTRLLAEHVGPDGAVHVVDASLDQLDIARRVLADLPRVRFTHARIEEVPLDAGVATGCTTGFC